MNDTYLKQIFREKSLFPIHRIRGKSYPFKYLVQHGKELLLIKAGESSWYNQLNNEYQKMQLLHSNGVPINEPKEFGILGNGKYVYWLSSWLYGRDVLSALRFKSSEKQYNIGMAAGTLLQKIHSVQNDYGISSIQKSIESCLASYEANINSFREFHKSSIFAKHLYNNRNFNRIFNCTVIHGDYHAKNLIYNNRAKLLSTIDCLSRMYADPYEDFVRLIVNGNRNPYYATGLVDSYFDDGIPDDFWESLKIYVCIHQIHIALWCINSNIFSKRFVSAQHHLTLYQYNNMNLTIPKYYKRSNTV